MVITENSSLTPSPVRRFADARFRIMTTDSDFPILDFKVIGKVNELKREETQPDLFLGVGGEKVCDKAFMASGLSA
jgi:hypothetical protein